MKTKLSILVGIMLLIGACVTMQPQPSSIAKGFGYGASSWYLSTHKDAIPKVQIALTGALAMLDMDKPDLYEIQQAIYDYAIEALMGGYEEAPLAARTALVMFGNMFDWMTPQTPEINIKYESAIRGFLLGVQQAIDEIKI